MSTQKEIERIYYLLTSLFWLATGIPISLFILFIQSRGINLFQVGILMGVYALVIVLLEVPTGGFADAVGRKKIAILAYSFSILSLILILSSFTFWLMLTGFISMGIGRALSSGALDAWFVDALQAINSEIDLQPVFSKAGSFTLLSLGVGSIIGSQLPNVFKFLPSDGGAIFTPLAMPTVFAIGIFLILIFTTNTLVVETLPGIYPSSWKEGFQKIPEIIKTGIKLSRNNPTILLLFGAGTAAGLALSSIENFWQPHFSNLFAGGDGNTLIYGVIMGGNFIVGMLGNMLASFISKRVGKRLALIAGVFQGIWGIMLFGLSSIILPLPAILLFWLTYLSIGVLNSPHQTLLNEEIPSAQRSAMLSIASLFNYSGGMLGSVALGFIAEKYSINFSWKIASVILIVSLVLYLRVDRIRKYKRKT